MRSVTRRRFLREVGAGAVGLPLLGAARHITANIVCSGDSITSGTGAEVPWPTPLAALLPGCTVTNVGISGHDLTWMTVGGPNQYVSDTITVDPLFVPGVPNVCVYFAGTNDIKFRGKTSVDLYFTHFTYCAARVAAGFRPVPVTMLPRGNFNATMTGYQHAINASARAEFHTFPAWAIADVCADTRIGDDADVNDLTYYQADTVHPNTAGHVVLAGIIAQAVLGVLAPQPLNIRIR